MSYWIEPGEEPCSGLVRVIGEQVDKLRDSCAEARRQPATFVHKARVRAKRIRAALRLLRPVLGRKAYAFENVWWRDSARGLSRVRDMTARSEALATLMPEIEADIDGAALRRLRWQFDRERRAYEAVIAVEDPVGRFCAGIGGRDFDALSGLEPLSRKALAHSLAKTYEKAQAAMADAYESDALDLFHEWRKQTKHHALQLRLVRHVVASVDSRIEAARDLAQLLGAVQDVEVLVTGLSALRKPSLIGALDGRRRAMLQDARISGEALFAQTSKDWSRAIAKGDVRAVAIA